MYTVSFLNSHINFLSFKYSKYSYKAVTGKSFCELREFIILGFFVVVVSIY